MSSQSTNQIILSLVDSKRVVTRRTTTANRPAVTSRRRRPKSSRCRCTRTLATLLLQTKVTRLRRSAQPPVRPHLSAVTVKVVLRSQVPSRRRRRRVCHQLIILIWPITKKVLPRRRHPRKQPNKQLLKRHQFLVLVQVLCYHRKLKHNPKWSPRRFWREDWAQQAVPQWVISGSEVLVVREEAEAAQTPRVWPALRSHRGVRFKQIQLVWAHPAAPSSTRTRLRWPAKPELLSLRREPLLAGRVQLRPLRVSIIILTIIAHNFWWRIVRRTALQNILEKSWTLVLTFKLRLFGTWVA